MLNGIKMACSGVEKRDTEEESAMRDCVRVCFWEREGGGAYVRAQGEFN